MDTEQSLPARKPRSRAVALSPGGVMTKVSVVGAGCALSCPAQQGTLLWPLLGHHGQLEHLHCAPSSSALRAGFVARSRWDGVQTVAKKATRQLDSQHLGSWTTGQLRSPAPARLTWRRTWVRAQGDREEDLSTPCFPSSLKPAHCFCQST